ncbi:hypothetical protein [Gracilimonas sp.]|uniref:hypothetical protein n=1 Tax=Gracilimonas sp. TaxID=1974203 RepID=UPI003BAC5A3C
MDDDMFKGFFEDPIDGFIKKYRANFGELTNYYTDDVVPTFRGNGQVKEDVLPTPISHSFFDVEEAVTQGQTLNDLLYGATTPLTTEQKVNMSRLSKREARLQPVEFGVLGGDRIPGNPFSIDTRGLLTGLGDVGEAVVNRARAKRRGEFEDELQGYREQQANNQAISDNRTAYLREFLNDSFQRATDEEADRKDHERAKVMEELKQKGDKDLAILKAELEEETSTGKAKDYSSQVVQRYFEAAYPDFYNFQSSRDTLLKARANLQNQLSETTTTSSRESIQSQINDIDDTLSTIEQKSRDIGTQMAKEMLLMGVVPPSSVFSGRLKEEEGANQRNTNTGDVAQSVTVTDKDVAEFAGLTGKTLEEARAELEAAAQGGE